MAPPKPSVEEGIDYAVEFAKSILDHPAVREVEFAASWTIPGAPSGFKSYIFPEQGKLSPFHSIERFIVRKRAWIFTMHI